MRKIVVAGTREFNDYRLLCDVLDFHINGEQVIIISGNAKGADSMGEVYASSHNLKCVKFPPDYETYPSKVAPLKRNEERAKEATEGIIFWDGVSRGTWNMIQQLRKYKKKVTIINYRKLV